MLKHLREYSIEGFDNVTSALIIENQLDIKTKEDFLKYFPDQKETQYKRFKELLANIPLLKNGKIFVETLKNFPKTEEIVVAGDYDCDGIMATVIMLHGLRNLGYKCHFKIPNRFDGYGAQSLENDIKRFKTKLIITVDNGVSLKDMVANAKENGAQVLITDHHLPDQENTPDCDIIDPHVNGDEFPDICGATVALKLIYQLYKEVAPSKLYIVDELTPLAGLATVADMMPMLEENRLLVKMTLNEMNYLKDSGSLTPLRKILFSLGGYHFFTKADINATEELISFSIAPAINAVSRVKGDVSELVRDILKALSDPYFKMPSYSDFNYTRQQITKEMMNDYKQDTTNCKSTVFIYDKNMYNYEIKGVLGLLANKVSHNNNLVALVGSERENGAVIDFSGRSIPGYNLHEGIQRLKAAHPELNITGGGHSNAMGIRIDNTKENIQTLKTALEEDVKQYSLATEQTEILFDPDDYELITPILSKLQPFGQKWNKLHFVYEGYFKEYDGNEKFATIGEFYFKYFQSNELDKYLHKDVIVEFTMGFDSHDYEVVYNVVSLKEKV